MMKIIAVLVLFMSVFSLPAPVFADRSLPANFYALVAPSWFNRCVAAGAGAAGQFCNLSPLQVIGIFLPNILVLAGVIFFVLILGGGFGIISGAGKDSSPQDKAKARAAITYGIVGFLLVVTSFFILQVVSTVTGVNFANPGI